MKTLRVALFIKPSNATSRREDRNMGYWSYPVDEFTWEHFPHDNQRVDLGKFKEYDLIFHEDAGFCTYANKHKGPPVVYLAIDSTLSDEHLRKRLDQARQADLVLVDHDLLFRFKQTRKPVRRFPYCVNERVFHPVDGKTHDIDFHCGAGASRGMPGGQERVDLRTWLHAFAMENDFSYRSGTLGLPEYAASMAGAKVVVNWPRTVINRPHRVFDAMACGAALLTAPIPLNNDDDIWPGEQYWTFESNEILAEQLGLLLRLNEWRMLGEAGYQRVMKRHTWKTRAGELREMLAEVLGL